MAKKTYTLSDNSIAQIARLLQIAMLTGTDIVDQLRTIYLEEGENGLLDPTEDYVSMFDEQINSLLDNLPTEDESNDTLHHLNPDVTPEA